MIEKRQKTCSHCETKYSVAWDIEVQDLEPLTCPFCGHEVEEEGEGKNTEYPASFFLKMGRLGIGVPIVREHDVSVDVSICRSFHCPMRVVFQNYLLLPSYQQDHMVLSIPNLV